MSTQVYLVTGANVGLGYEAVRQLASRQQTKLVLMACRTESKALAAIDTLVKDHQIPKDKLSFFPFDASASKESISKTVDKLTDVQAIHGLIFNAGGTGHDASGKPVEPNGVVDMFQINLIGHIHFLEALMANNRVVPKQTTIVFSGSEAARGVPMMMMGTPKIPTTVEEIKKVLDGTFFKRFAALETYAYVKAIGALYWSAWAQKNPDYFTLTVSPGATSGTAFSGHSNNPKYFQLVGSNVLYMLGFLGQGHPVQVGAKRYVDGVLREGDFSSFPSGTFVASASGTSGTVIDQSKHSRGTFFADASLQTAAYDAVSSFV